MVRRKSTGKFASSFSSSSTSSSSSSSSSTKLCAICSERAIGKNFGSLSCMSCKAFFRRHARNEKEKLKCPFEDNCQITKITRKFCSKCRLKRCFDVGMKKDNILTEEQRQKMREKIAQNRLLREQSKAPKRKRKSSVVSNFSSNSNGSNSSSLSTSASHSKGDNSIVVEYLIKQQKQQKDRELIEFEDTQADPCSVSVLGPDNYFPSLLAKSEYDDLYIGGCGGDYPEWPMDPYLDEYCNELLGDDLFMESSSSSTEHITEAKPSISEQSNKLTKDHDYTSIATESCFPPSPSTPEPFSSTSNFLLSYLNSNSPSDFLEPLNPFTITCDPVIESLNPVADPQSVYGEIGFSPSQELLLPEKCLIKELTAACSVLQNSYTRLETVEEYDGSRASHLSACLFNRLEQMANRLDAFRRLNTADQRRMLQGPQLLEMAAIRSVLLYDEYRDAWCVFDDKEKTSVFLKLDSFAPFCTTNSIERHKAFPRLFFDEWKRDSIIFDLLTAVLLFTPRPEYLALDEISESYSKYQHLLKRYLCVKYASVEEADRAYAKLQANLEEMRILSPDVQSFFQQSSNINNDSGSYLIDCF